MSDNEDATVLLTNDGGHESLSEDQQASQRLSNNGATIPSDANPKGSSSFLLMSACMAAIGGLLFGYDIGIISTALPQIKAQFSLTCFQQEMVVSLMLVGALFASLVGGSYLDYSVDNWFTLFIFLGGGICLCQVPSSIKLGAEWQL